MIDVVSLDNFVYMFLCCEKFNDIVIIFCWGCTFSAAFVSNSNCPLVQRHEKQREESAAIWFEYKNSSAARIFLANSVHAAASFRVPYLKFFATFARQHTDWIPTNWPTTFYLCWCSTERTSKQKNESPRCDHKQINNNNKRIMQLIL